MGEDREDLPDTARVRWSASIRLVSASYPPVRVFEDTAAPEDLETALAVLAITDRSAHRAAGDLGLVPPHERVSGPGSSAVMAAFTHPSPQGSRFADASAGAYYAADTMDTAIAETAFHQARLLGQAGLDSVDVELNVYLARIDVRLHDVRGARDRFPEPYAPDPADYGPAQAFARRLRDAGANGLVYDSVRRAGGECVALFRPRTIQLPVRQSGRVVYHWDGSAQSIARVSVLAAGQRSR